MFLHLSVRERLLPFFFQLLKLCAIAQQGIHKCFEQGIKKEKKQSRSRLLLSVVPKETEIRVRYTPTFSSCAEKFLDFEDLVVM